MSTPTNPLSRFHTYSYHHILMVANDISIVRAFEQREISLTSLTSPSFANDDLKITPKKLKNSNGEYVVLINGATDAEFVMSKVNWSTFVAGVTGNNYTLTNALVEGSMEVLEPKGFRFLNAIKRSLDALEVHPSTAFFVLKTVFVGHNDDGSVEIINNVKPFSFTILDIVANFDETGSTYTIEFVGTTNGTSKMPHYINAGIKGIHLSDDSKLSTAIAKLNYKIHEAYEDYKKDVTAKLNITTGQDITDFYRLVLYSIELDPQYLDDRYKIDQLNETVQDKGGDNKEGITLSFGSKTTIDSMIYKIMNLCSRVHEDSKGKNNDGKKLIFKIHSTIEDRTSASFRNFGSEIWVKYLITPYEVPVVSKQNASTGYLANVQSEDVLEFDYIYTGKNVDILSMDLKMQMGLQFFYTLTASSNMSTPKGTRKFKMPDDGIEVSASAEESHNKRRNLTPLFFPSTSTETTSKHLKKPAEKLNFESLLKRHAALESLETKIEIHGNPYILNDLVLTPSELSNSANNRSGNTAFRNWHKRPALIKVNVKMPNTNDYNFSPTSFWYEGYYMPIEIVSSFDGGEFRQTIDMISLPVEQETSDSDPIETDPLNKQQKTETDDNRNNRNVEPAPPEEKRVAPPEEKKYPNTRWGRRQRRRDQQQ